MEVVIINNGHEGDRQWEDLMGRLDDIQAALTSNQQIAADEAAQVSTALAGLRQQVTDLQATIDGMTAGAVDQADIDALTAQAQDLGVAIEAIDPEGDTEPTV